MTAYMKRLEELDLDRMSSGETRTLQRVNIILNHALGMASEGANLVMVARMGMAGTVDRFSLEQGERMIAHARDLHRETMEGEAMRRLRDLGVTPETSSMMKLTQDLADDVSRIIELLARMPPAPSVAAPAR
jgi:DNA-directed RNA polymerase specialized sigma subunit